MKMYNKSDVKFVEGRFISDDNEIITVNPDIIFQVNKLETRYQKAMWVKDQPVASEGPDFNEFKRVSVKDISNRYGFSVDTPNLDNAVMESIAIMNEIDGQNIAEEINNELYKFTDLVRWCESENIFDDGEDYYYKTVEFDAPMLFKEFGNILEWTPETVRDIILAIYKEPLERNYGIELGLDEDCDNGESE